MAREECFIVCKSMLKSADSVGLTSDVCKLCLCYGAVYEVSGGVSEMPSVLGVRGMCLGRLGVQFEG